jgi:GTPase SAR1 family protein
MRWLLSALGGIAFLAAAAWGLAAGQQAHAPEFVEEAFERSLPDTEAGAALQARLGDPRLTGQDKEIEREAFELLARDEDRLVADYISRHGRVVNTDDARELFAAYRADRSRAAAVHEPASEVSEKVYARLLEENRGTVKEVLFLAGGGGSGKTTALRVLLGRQVPEAITFDGTFSDPGSNMQKIRQALDAGYEVRVAYIHVEDPLKALGNALDRTERMAAEKGSGRTVPAATLIEQHASAREAFVDAAEKLEDDPRVSFQVIDNSGGLDDIRSVGSSDTAVAFMRQRLYDEDDVGALKVEAEELVEARLRAGTISERTYRGFSGRVPEEAGPDS